MGTRNLTAVMLDGEYRVAQYGQWDGYPSGQGLTILRFLHQWSEYSLFKEAIREVEFFSDEEIDQMGPSWKQDHPQISRDVGGEILSYVDGGCGKLVDNISFAGDSLMCEYAYVVDLDKNTFEVFEGFNKDVVEDGRFVSGDTTLDKVGEFHPVKLVRTYSLDDLPTEEDFLNELERDEDDE